MSKQDLEIIMIMTSRSGERRLALDPRGVLFVDAPHRRNLYHCSLGESHLEYWRSHRAPWRFYCAHEVNEIIDPKLEKLELA